MAVANTFFFCIYKINKIEQFQKRSKNVVFICMGLSKAFLLTTFYKIKLRKINLLSVQEGGSSTRPVKDRHSGEPVFLYI